MPTDTGFANAQDRNAQQQRALLASIAESGSAGAQAYQQAQAENQQLQQGALAQASGNAGSLAVGQGALANSKASFEADIARQQAANTSYMSQLGAAIPISEARTKLGVEQIMAKTAQDKANNDLQMQQSQLQLQGQREQIAGQREARADAHAQAGADRSITPYQMAQLELAKADNKRADDQNSAKASAIEDAKREAKRNDYVTGLRGQLGTTDSKGNVKDAESFKAIYDVVNGYSTLDEALAKYKTPGGKQLDRPFVQAAIDRFNRL